MAEDYETIWNTLEMDRTVELGQTMLSDRASDWRDTLRNSLPLLPVGDQDDAQFRVASVIGRGGMGVVHEARQRSLARDVAIKTVPPEKVSRQAENALLQEARAMGLVEHPNVVPVHIIGQDDQGRPVIVMKRVHGTPWSDYIDGVEPIPHDDPLVFHLDVARAICRALSFAHDRGVIHRDIKPENVMIGRFGEIYLLDWGLAAALGENDAKIPSVEGADEVVGTPAFMAPEMTVGRGAGLGVWTDIFLLGATLFTAVAGTPPHQGDSLFAVMSAAYMGRRAEYPVGSPAELREICERAMALEPTDRFESADEMRDALESFLSHRSSHMLVNDARKRLFALRDAITRDDEDAAHQVFGEARFGFVSALKIWDENVDATDGLQETVVAMIEYELEQENIAAARRLHTQLPRPNHEIAEAIETLGAELHARESRLEKIAFDYDEDVGIGERRRLIGGMGALLMFAPFIKWWWVEDWVVPEALRGFSSDSVVLVTVFFGLTFLPILAGIVRITVKQYRHHKVSRIFTLGMVVMYIFGMLIRVQALFGLELHYALAAELSIHATGLFCLGLAIDRRMGRAAFIATGAVFGILAFPEYAVELFCYGLGLGAIGFAAFRRSFPMLPWADDDVLPERD